jgi:hypothetical protein
MMEELTLVIVSCILMVGVLMEAIMKKLLYAAVVVFGMFGVSEGMSEQGAQETFRDCCRAVATRDEKSGKEAFGKLERSHITCENLIQGLQPYCSNHEIDYLQFKLHQAEILVYLSLMSYAILNNCLNDLRLKGRFIHWYNKQTRLIKSWS